ncbi:MAG: ATP-binding protein [bacterium]
MLTWYAMGPFVAWLLMIFAWAVVYGKRRQAPVNRAYLFFTAVCAGWLLLDLLAYLPLSLGHEILIHRLMTPLWMATGLLCLHFVYRLLGRPHDTLFWALLVATIVGASIGLSGDLLFRGFTRTAWGIAPIYTPITYPLICLIPASSALISLGLVIRQWFREPRTGLRMPLALISVGGSITFLLVVALNVALPLLGALNFPRFGSSSTVVLVYAVVLAVTRYDFLSITAEQVAEELFDNVHEGILVTDKKGHILHTNRTARVLLSGAGASLVGSKVSTILPGWRPAARQEEQLLTYPQGGEERTYALTTLASRPRGRSQVDLVVLQDITEQQQAEQVLAEKRAELELEIHRRTEELTQLQRMEAITTLASGIAHDFNNLLAVIMGSTTAARDDLPEGHAARSDLDAVLRAARRGRDVVQQILDLGQVDPPDQRPTTIGHLVADTLALLEKSLPSDIHLEHLDDAGNATVSAYPAQLQRALLNLCTNAVQAMHRGGGTLRVAVTFEELTAATAVERPRLTAGTYVRIAVSDTGNGMDAETRARIFEPFFTTKAAHHGTGLGLSTTLQIISNHQGAIEVQSTPGEGSTFAILLPHVRRDVARQISEELSVAGGTERLLIVDDNELVARAARWMLEALGYTVDTVTSGEEALQAFRGAPPPYDLVITDQTMPGMKGDRLVEELLTLDPSLPIILMSGYTDGGSFTQLDDTRAVEFHPKPLSKAGLGTAIRRLLDR